MVIESPLLGPEVVILLPKETGGGKDGTDTAFKNKLQWTLFAMRTSRGLTPHERTYRDGDAIVHLVTAPCIRFAPPSNLAKNS